jgi:hypothetical protein
VRLKAAIDEDAKDLVSIISALYNLDDNVE